MTGSLFFLAAIVLGSIIVLGLIILVSSDARDGRKSPALYLRKWQPSSDSDRIKNYDVAIRDHPRNAALYLQRGKTHLKLKDYEQAIQDYDRVFSLEAGNAAVYNDRGWAY